MSRRSTRLSSPNGRSAFAANLNAALSSTTSEAFARRIDKPLRTVQRWRAGHTEPKGEALLLVARELGITVEDLYAEPDTLEPAA